MSHIENAFEMARKQIRNVCDLYEICRIDNNKYEIISVPRRVIEINIPVRMDDGSIKIFQAFRSQHNDARWPFKWGIRFHQDVTRDEVKALSMWMSLKTAVVDIPLGGGKWGIVANPKELSLWELERLSRGYVRELYRYLGPETDVPAPDVNTTPQIMAWMMDEYSKLVGYYSPGSFTWKPLSVWGSKGRDKATAQGWVYVLETILKKENLNISWKKIILQWAWNVGLTTAKLLTDEWAILVWIADSGGAVYDSTWIDITKIVDLKSQKKSVKEYGRGDVLKNPHDILTLNCDILIPAALENQITSENAGDIQASYILELANGPTTPDADTILEKNNINVIPDILANAGGVMVSYFEQVQNDMNFYWEAAEIEEKLRNKMIEATLAVHQTKAECNTSYRSAAYMIAMERIFDAMQIRGEV